MKLRDQDKVNRVINLLHDLNGLKTGLSRKDCSFVRLKVCTDYDEIASCGISNPEFRKELIPLLTKFEDTLKHRLTELGVECEE